jgi:hypothetical protein
MGSEVEPRGRQQRRIDMMSVAVQLRRATLGLLTALSIVLLAACGSTVTADPPRADPTPQVSFSLYTHCGIDELQYHGKFYERVGGALDDGNGNPPPGWDNPYQPGMLSEVGDVLVFTDSRGHREQFALRPGATQPKRICM